jgi:hypothetical protein
MASQVSVVKLTDTNYHQRCIEIQDPLGSAGLWPAITCAVLQNRFCPHDPITHCNGDRLAAARQQAWEGRRPRAFIADPRWQARLLHFLELSDGEDIYGAT